MVVAAEIYTASNFSARKIVISDSYTSSCSHVCIHTSPISSQLQGLGESNMLALCCTIADFACSWRGRSRHSKHVDTALNYTCRIITGCLKVIGLMCEHARKGHSKFKVEHTDLTKKSPIMHLE